LQKLLFHSTVVAQGLTLGYFSSACHTKHRKDSNTTIDPFVHHERSDELGGSWAILHTGNPGRPAQKIDVSVAAGTAA
jgi:hypothetical protein